MSRLLAWLRIMRLVRCRREALAAGAMFTASADLRFVHALDVIGETKYRRAGRILGVAFEEGFRSQLVGLREQIEAMDAVPLLRFTRYQRFRVWLRKYLA